mmetsp:Transcript_12954/g.17895  ORF Transcript_12954/g.17895 Transcript_12954/m.17895 type:complete len:225 (+) Transcript_12954:256-930(+)
MSTMVCLTTFVFRSAGSSLCTRFSTIAAAFSLSPDLSNQRGDSGRKMVVTNRPRAGNAPESSIHLQSLGRPASSKFTRKARGIPTLMNISLKLVIEPRMCRGASSAQYIGQMTRPIPTPIPVKNLQLISASKFGELAIPIDPIKKMTAAERSPFFRPNLSATVPATNDPKMDAKVILEVSISTSPPLRSNSSFIGTIAPLIIPRSYPRRRDPNAAVKQHPRRKG